ncbi:hypothetical protein [Paraburkholderia sp. MM6662-R1]|uniref:hypothetical protein n=1 Tax=Paraburkholderia sp. MM6662-R1 TaxID=2991066 RepID=UPI003D19C404
MAIERPPLHSVWENAEGDKYFVEDVSEPLSEKEIANDPDIKTAAEADDARASFLVTYVPYDDRGDEGAIGYEADHEEWADFVKENVLKQIGIELGPRIL